MGLRYRKSINLGGGFRINHSKSGTGYSWGTKGYRITKKAGGGIRTTYSIPGTGLYWVKDSKKRKNKKRGSGGKSNSRYTQPEVITTGEYLYRNESADVKQLVNDNNQEFLDAVVKYSKKRSLLTIVGCASFVLMFFVPFFVVTFFMAIIGLVVLSKTKRISAEYEFDDYGIRRNNLLQQAMDTLISNKKIWQIKTIETVSTVKINAGASSTVNRKEVKFKKKKPYFLNTDANCYYIKLMENEIFILPDRLIVKGKKGWGTVEYSDIKIDIENEFFVESGGVPSDATISGYTWQYVNKNGSPDKRFKNNRQLPKCNYGKLLFRTNSNSNFNILLHASSLDKILKFADTVKVMIDEAKAKEEKEKMNNSEE